MARMSAGFTDIFYCLRKVWDENAGLSEGEGGGVDGILSRELPETESLSLSQFNPIAIVQKAFSCYNPLNKKLIISIK